LAFIERLENSDRCLVLRDEICFVARAESL